jgi:hypothetical protein
MSSIIEIANNQMSLLSGHMSAQKGGMTGYSPLEKIN